MTTTQQTRTAATREPSTEEKVDQLFAILAQLNESLAQPPAKAPQIQGLSDDQRQLFVDALEGKRKAVKAIRRDFKSREKALVAMVEARATGNDPAMKAFGDIEEAERALASAEARGLIRVKANDKSKGMSNSEIAVTVAAVAVTTAVVVAGGVYAYDRFA